MTVAAIRPYDWNLPLLVHVLGAMVLVGAIATAAGLLLTGWRRDAPGDSAVLARLGFWTLLLVALPGFLVMRLSAEWVRSKEGIRAGEAPPWIDIGYMTADAGSVVLLLALLLAGLGARQLRRSDGRRAGLTRASSIFAVLLLAAYVVAVWAMTAKPD